MNPIKKYKSLYQNAVDINQQLVLILGYKSHVSALRRATDLLWCWIKYKVTPIAYMEFEFYKLNKYARREYITDALSNKIAHKLNSNNVIAIIGDKKATLDYYSSWIHRNWLYITSETTNEQIYDFVSMSNEYIVKPIDGSCGKGVVKSSGVDYLKSIREKNKKYVAEEIIMNHEDLAVLNPSSLNTLRVNTCIDKNGKVHIFNISLRVGGKGNICDNLNNGGVMYPVDLETGYVCSAGIGTSGKKFVFHPSSGIFMLGFKLPFFDKLKDYVINLTQVLPEARYIGWDIAITPNGFELLEANSCPGVVTFQINGGQKRKLLAWI